MNFNILLHANMRGIGVAKGKNVLPPYNTEKTLGNNRAVPVKSLIRNQLKGSKSRFITPMCGYAEAMSRFYHMMHTAWLEKSDHFGGCAMADDGSYLFEMVNIPAILFDTVKHPSDYEDYEHILMRYAPKEANPVSACVLPAVGERKRYIVSQDNNRSEEKRTAVALLYMEIAYVYLKYKFLILEGKTKPASADPVFTLVETLNDLVITSDEASFDFFTASCANFYDLFANYSEYEAKYGNNFIDLIDLPNNPEIPMLDLSKKYEHQPMNTAGSLIYFDKLMGNQEATAVKKVKKIPTVKDLAGAYDPDPDRVRTAEEIEMLSASSIVDDMVPSTELLYIATLIQKSTNTAHTFRNFILRGPSGTGKSTMVQQLAKLLNIPAVIFSMNPDTDKLDLTLSAIPAAAKGTSNESIEDFMKKYPSAAAWAIDPAGSYQEITGQEKPDATALDCEKAVLALYQEQAGNGQNFDYVESEIIKAVKYGWIVEVQEPTICQRPGVLASLNSLTDDSQTVELMTGEIVHRHKDSIIVYTTNDDYEGCYPLNQSQLSRFSVLTINAPERKELVERLEKQSGLHDKKILRGMVTVYERCKELATSKGITDGAIDFRALLDWAAATELMGNVYENGVHMFIEKTTSDPEVQKQFLDCLDSEFVAEKI